MPKPQEEGFPVETVEEALAFVGNNISDLFKSEVLTDILGNMAEALRKEDPTDVVHAAVLVVVLVDERTGEIKVLRGMDVLSRAGAVALADVLNQTAEIAATSAEVKDVDA